MVTKMLEGKESTRLAGRSSWPRGLGFIRDMAIDQHFAQRARTERLLGAMEENPGVLGVGIEERTAVHRNRKEVRCDWIGRCVCCRRQPGELDERFSESAGQDHV